MAYRPGPGGRLRYALGGRLPAHRDWVRHDLTDAGWRWRGLGRVLVQVAPVAVGLALLPGPAILHVLMPLFVVLCALFIGGAYGEDLRDRRLRQHGFPSPSEVEPPPD
ncbi:MAG: DUF5313 family protein [Mycobacteriales bacterium]